MKKNLIIAKQLLVIAEELAREGEADGGAKDWVKTLAIPALLSGPGVGLPKHETPTYVQQEDTFEKDAQEALDVLKKQGIDISKVSKKPNYYTAEHLAQVAKDIIEYNPELKGDYLTREEREVVNQMFPKIKKPGIKGFLSLILQEQPIRDAWLNLKTK